MDEKIKQIALSFNYWLWYEQDRYYYQQYDLDGFVCLKSNKFMSFENLYNEYIEKLNKNILL